MNTIRNYLLILTLATVSLSTPASAMIEKDGHRFSLGGGLVYVKNNASLAIGAEYEYRIAPLYGVGAQANYVFSTDALTMVSAPIFFLHPLLGEWYISAAPIFYFGSGTTTQVGARFTTRMPLNLDVLMFTPTLGVDIIKGGPNYILGLSFGI